MDRYALISWLTHSVVPSVWGWNAVDRADFIPTSFNSSMNDFEVNCGPRSEIILSGSPNLLYKLSSRSFAVSSALIVLLHGRRITPLLRPWSTTTRIESKLSMGGRSDEIHGTVSKRSSWICSLGRLECRFWWMSVNFKLLTDTTSLDIVLYKCS